MKLSTHTHLARELTKHLEVFREASVAAKLIEGVSEKEAEGRRLRRASRDKAIEEMWMARKAFLRGEVEEAAYHLGKAIYHVQELCVGTPLVPGAREDVEYQIERIAFSEQVDEEAIEKASRYIYLNPLELEELISGIRGETNPEAALVNAAQLTGILGASVFSNKPCPLDYVNEYESMHRRHLFAWVAGAVACLLIALPSPIFPPVLLLLPLSYEAYRAVDEPFRRAKKKVEWYRA